MFQICRPFIDLFIVNLNCDPYNNNDNGDTFMTKQGLQL